MLVFVDDTVDAVWAVCKERAVATVELRTMVRSWSVFILNWSSRCGSN